MTVHFMCACGSRPYQLPNTMATERVRCPNCLKMVVVPEPCEQVVLAKLSEDQEAPHNYGL